MGSNSGIGVARIDLIVRRKFFSAFFEMLDGVVGCRTDTNNQKREGKGETATRVLWLDDHKVGLDSVILVLTKFLFFGLFYVPWVAVCFISGSRDDDDS